MKFSSVPFLARVTPAAPAGGPLDAVNVTSGFDYGKVLTLTIPAVTSGNSLIVAAVSEQADTRVDGSVEDAGGVTMLWGSFGHFFHIDNVTDGRTSLTLRTFNGGGSPTDSNTSWWVWEVDASAIDPASTVASSVIESNGTALNQAYTTTEDDAFAVLIANLSNSATPTGGSGWVGIGSATYTPAGYIEDAGAAGAKTADLTLDAGRFRGMAVQAYARA